MTLEEEQTLYREMKFHGKDFQQKPKFNIETIDYIGEQRKGVAIGKYKSNNGAPCLVKADKIIFSGYSNYDYTEEILRNIEGYYLCYSYKNHHTPGKDDDTYERYLSKVYS